MQKKISKEILNQSDVNNGIKSDVKLLGDLLKNSKSVLSVAESCTGGNISHQITSLSGSSSFFWGGVVAYDNSIKQNVLNVSCKDLTTYGAVSKQVVEQMATGVKSLMKTDWAVATSGIAGPTGGTKEKPVGTVWIAWAGPNGVDSVMYSFCNDRNKNIELSTDAAICGLITRLKNS